MRIVEVIQASGHPEIRSTHSMTLEITRETHLTKRGDCIVATGASKGCADLSPEFVRLMKNNKTRVTLTIESGERHETITGMGDANLILTHPTDMVARKSNYTCNRTIMVQADKSASDLDREFVKTLRDPNRRIRVEFVAELDL
jgi:hypothetical protein